jgi:hypothetical protein
MPTGSNPSARCNATLGSLGIVMPPITDRKPAAAHASSSAW